MHVVQQYLVESGVRANKFKFPKTMITKYCFPNLHWILVKAFEVKDCEFVPVHHQQYDIWVMKHKIHWKVVYATHSSIFSHLSIRSLRRDECCASTAWWYISLCPSTTSTSWRRNITILHSKLDLHLDKADWQRPRVQVPWCKTRDRPSKGNSENTTFLDVAQEQTHKPHKL